MIFAKNWIGDVIFAEPLIRVLKKQYPQSYLICVAPPRCKSFLAKNPHIDEILTFDEKGSERSFLARIRFIFKLRKKAINRVYLLHRSFSRAFMCYTAGIRERIGYDTKGRGGLLTQKYTVEDTIRNKEHDVDYFMRLAGDIKATDNEREYRFYFSDDDKAHAESLLRSKKLHNNKFIVINPGGNWLPKRWPIEYFARFANLFYEQFSLPVVISGNESNQKLADNIIEMTNYQQCVSLCGKTTLTQVGALFSRSMFVLTADSGPMHIASGVGAPVVALFGPTDFTRTGPRGVGEKIILYNRDATCSIPCYEMECKKYTCMSNISPEMVMDAVQKLLANQS
ncbi:lipopolysaccharide heptosyltransferase II [Candidatus Omnitrophota bacterium]